jgi:hypothetical protein
MTDASLDTYLNDHLAGAMFGADLARQIAAQVQATERARRFADLAAEIEADRRTLAGLMDRLGTTANPVKQAVTWMTEKLSRVKLSGIGRGADELNLFMALETLSLGVEGKASLWRALRDVVDRYPALDATELDGLIARAEDQRRRVESERIDAGRRAFGGSVE